MIPTTPNPFRTDQESCARSVAVVVTTACNQRCSYCYQRRDRPRQMRWPVLRRAVDLLTESGHRQTSLLLYGGEPLLAADLVRRGVEYARSRVGGPDRLTIRLPTNGLLLDDELLAFFDRHRVHLQLSFDGVPDVQRLRSEVSVEVLPRLAATLRSRFPGLLRERVRVAMTVSSATVGRFAASVASLIDLGFEDVAAGAVRTHDPGWTADTTAELDRQLARVRVLCTRRVEEVGRVGFTPLARTRTSDPRDRDERADVCAVPEGERLFVDVDGGLAPCLMLAPSFAPSSPSPLAAALSECDRGNLSRPWDDDVLERFRRCCRATGLFRDRDRKWSRLGQCSHCEARSECVPCPVATAWIPGNTEPYRVPDPVCAFTRLVAAHRARMPPLNTPYDVLMGTATPPRAVQRLIGRAR
jgi:sulfatase maturation enzyme AslB (radical SAM superfamily)